MTIWTDWSLPVFSRPMCAAVTVGFALIGGSALAQQPKQGTPKSEPAPLVAQQPPDISPALKGIEAAIREYLLKDDKAENERKENREIANLLAQQDMVFWTKVIFWSAVAGLVLTLIGLVLTSVGLWLLYHTLRYTRTAAEASVEAVGEAQNATAEAKATNAAVTLNAQLELRAYISVVPAGINELIGNHKAMGHVDVKNVGRLPARNVQVEVRMKIENREKTVDERLADFPVADRKRELIDRVIQPGAEMRQGANEDDTIPVGNLLSDTTKYVYVWGVVHYHDGYKDSVTRFRHRYAIASYNRDLNLTGAASQTRAIITTDKARYHPFGNYAT